MDVATVCVQATNAKTSHAQFFANVALKLNMKMGGVNHTLEHPNPVLKGQPTMLVGMDVRKNSILPHSFADDIIQVTHPGPGAAKGTPSIAGVVASVDNQFGQFPASLRIQESKKEVNPPPILPETYLT